MPSVMESLIAVYKLNGVLKDYTGSYADAVWTGNEAYAKGSNGRQMASFDNASYIRLIESAGLKFTDDFAVTFRMRLVAVALNDALIGDYNTGTGAYGWLLRLDASGKIFFSYGGTSGNESLFFTSLPSVDDGREHTVTLTVLDSVATLKIGESVESVTMTKVLTTSELPITIGASPSSGTARYEGLFGDLYFNGEAITLDQNLELNQIIETPASLVPIDLPIPASRPELEAILALAFADETDIKTDVSGTDNNITPIGGLKQNADGAIVGNGTSAYATIDSQTDFPIDDEAHYWYGWVYVFNITSYMNFMSYGTNTSNHAWFMRMDNDGTLYHGYWSNDIKTVDKLIVGWNMIGYQYDGGAQSAHSKEHLIIDGVKVDFVSTAGGGTPDITLSAFANVFASHGGGTPANFANALMRGMVMKAGVLTDAEWMDRYRQGVPYGADDLKLSLTDGSDGDHSVNKHTITRGAAKFGNGMSFPGAGDVTAISALGNIQALLLDIELNSDTEGVVQLAVGKTISVVAGVVTYTGITPVRTVVNASETTAIKHSQRQTLLCVFETVDADAVELNKGSETIRYLKAFDADKSVAYARDETLMLEQTW